MTNFEKIKTMSVEEMAEHMKKTFNCATGCCPIRKFCHKYGISCEAVIKKYLESEVEEDKNENDILSIGMMTAYDWEQGKNITIPMVRLPRDAFIKAVLPAAISSLARMLQS